MSCDAKWYAGWIRLLPASSAAEKIRNLEAADFIEKLEAENKQYHQETTEMCMLREKVHRLEAQVPKWISVEERLPDKVEDVLAHSKGGIGIGCYFQSTKLWANDSFHSWEITHWMPLPEPPKEDKDE